MKQHFKSAGQGSISYIFRFQAPPKHVHVIARVAELGIGVDIRQAQPMPISIGGQGGHLGDQPHDLAAAHRRIADVPRLRIEGRKRGHHRHQRAHRMGIVMEGLQQLLHVFRNQQVLLDLAVPGGQFSLGGKLPVQEKERDFEERAVFGKLLDRVAPVSQDAAIAIQIGDRTLARRRVHERRVVRHQPEIARAGLNLPQVHGADRAVLNGYGIRLLGAIIGDGKGLVAHLQGSS